MRKFRIALHGACAVACVLATIGKVATGDFIDAFAWACLAGFNVAFVLQAVDERKSKADQTAEHFE